MEKENRKEKRTETEKGRDRRKQRQKQTEKRKGGKGFLRIWLSCWWPVLVVVVLFLIAGTSVVYQIQDMMEEEWFISMADSQIDEFQQIQENYEQQVQIDPKSAYENALATLEWNVNLGFFSEDTMGVYLCDEQGAVVAEREPALYLMHSEGSTMHYYRCADKAMEQRVLETYEGWLEIVGQGTPRPVLRIDEAYVSGTKCYPIKVNIYSVDSEVVQEGMQENIGIYFHLQETITAEEGLVPEDGIRLTNLDIMEDGDSIGGMGTRISDAREAGVYYTTNMNLFGEELPKLSEDMKELIFPTSQIEGTDASDEIEITYESVAAAHFELHGEDNKLYRTVVMPVSLGSEQYYFVVMERKQREGNTDIYVALGWVLGILFSAFIALVIAKGFARTMRKEQELICRQRDYTNALAHDLKTPLMAISGYTENLQSNVNPEKKEHYYEAIYSNINYMSRLIMDMLSLAQLQRPEETLCTERIELRSLAEVVTAGFEQELAEKNLNLEIKGSGYLEADPRLLERACRNLVENAVKYSPAGELIRIQLADGSIQITNTGVALPKEKWNAVFQPFVKGDEVRERGTGTGLGLAIVRDIAELHGFQCRLECAEQATTVTIES